MIIDRFITFLFFVAMISVVTKCTIHSNEVKTWEHRISCNSGFNTEWNLRSNSNAYIDGTTIRYNKSSRVMQPDEVCTYEKRKVVEEK